MSDDLTQRQAERDEAVAAISDAVDQIETARREPDLWERVFLAEAINATFRGLYHLAAVGADKAMTPASGRSSTARLPTDPFQSFDLAVLRQALAQVSAEPVQRFGHFGPIVFTEQSQ